MEGEPKAQLGPEGKPSKPRVPRFETELQEIASYLSDRLAVDTITKNQATKWILLSMYVRNLKHYRRYQQTLALLREKLVGLGIEDLPGDDPIAEVLPQDAKEKDTGTAQA